MPATPVPVAPAPPVPAAPSAVTGRRGPTLAHGVALVLVVLGFAVGARPLADNSAFTHLATGRLILDRWSVPDVDPYSWTAAGEPWVVQSWLASVVYAAAEASVGLWGVRAVNGALAAAVVAATWALTGPARALVPRLALTAAVIGVGTTLWPPRPLLFGLVGVCAVLLVLARRLPPPWLLPAFALWGATHGSFPLGLALVVAAAAGAALDRRALPRRELSALVWSATGALVVVLGPLGLDGLLFPVRLLGRQDVLGEVREWRPPSYATPAEWLWVALVVAAVAVFARQGARWRELLPALLAVVLGLVAVRNLSVSSLVLVAAVAPSLRREPQSGRLDPDERGPRALVLVVAAALLGAASLVPVVRGAPLALARYPVAELAALEARGLLGDPEVRLLTRDAVGNYLELRLGERAGVFIDDRVDMYPPSLVRDYVVLLHGGDQGAVLDRWRPDVVLWDVGTPLHHWLEADPAWDLVHQGEDHVVFCRADSPARSRCG